MNEHQSGPSSPEKDESFPRDMSGRLPDSHIAFLLDVKLALMGGAVERCMLRRMQSRLHPGLERALMDLNSIALTLHASPAPSSSSTLESGEFTMKQLIGMPVDYHFSPRLGLWLSSFLFPRSQS